MHVTWNQLRMFAAVARLGSFTRAAEELHVVQPTVSAQIRLLADSVGLPLFEQIGKKVFLTEAGRELQQTCTELFDAWSRFEMIVADLRGVKKGTLRLAIVSDDGLVTDDYYKKGLEINRVLNIPSRTMVPSGYLEYPASDTCFICPIRESR